MQNLIDNIDKIAIIKNDITDYYKHACINNKDITNDTITIIMTSHNRSKQVYFTLKTIADSNFKNIQVVIVDDSDKDKVSTDKLQEYPFYIDFIEIDRNKKFWINPCVNYNIGFKYIKGVKIIIQNSEVCHIGDVLSYVNLNIRDENYYVFDVKNSPSFEYNEHIYNLPVLYHNIFYDDNPLLKNGS